MAEKIIRVQEVAERVGLSISTIQRLVRNGSMPAPVQLAERAVGWRASDIDQWISDRPTAVADRSNAA